MPPRGVKSPKRARQYEHIKESARKRGTSTRRAKAIAARTVNKQRSEAGQTKGAKSRKSSAAKSSRKPAARKSTARKSTRRTTGARKKK